MELPNNPAGAPALPAGFERRLKAIDRDLHIRYHEFYPDTFDPSKPFLKENGEPIEFGRWVIYSKDADARLHIITILWDTDADGAYVPPDERALKALESDTVRVLGPKMALAHYRDMKAKEKAAGMREHRNYLEGWADDNKHIIRRAAEDPFKKKKIATVRDPKVFSYGGQRAGKDLAGRSVEKDSLFD